MSFILRPSIILPVDYDDQRRWSISPDRAEHINCHPHIEREHFPINATGSELIKFGFLVSDAEFTTGEGLQAIKDTGVLRPNLADTHTYSTNYPKAERVLPFTSLCGAEHIQYGFPFIAYAVVDLNGTSLFFNWMTFRRPAGTRLLVVIE